jgi:hypothetical protein
MRTIASFLVLFIAASAWAQAPASDSAALEQKVRDLEDRVIALEGQLRVMKEQQAAQPATPPAPPGTQSATAVPSPTNAEVPPAAQASPVPSIGGAQSNAKALNPDISAIGDFIASGGGNTPSPFAGVQPFPSFSMHEAELGFQSIVDPYARADFFISFGEQGVDLEEGYITFTSLPAGFVARAGKMRAAFGKVNTMHNHVLPWIDRPIMNYDLLGGEDGIDDAGVSIQRILPAPKGIFLEATGQVFRGDSGIPGSNPLFVSGQKSHVSTVAHLRGYGDLSESTNLDLGLSYARGHNDAGIDTLTNLYGFDATLRWKPLRRAIYHSFLARAEGVWSQRQQLPFTQRSFGMYASADYQLGRRWFAGGRYDYAHRPTNQFLLDRGFSAVLSYWPSEFAQIRGQFRRTQYGEGMDANELMMQVQFSIGAHGAHPF